MKPDDGRAEKFAGEIGRLLRDRRKELGITQTGLARLVGVSQQQIVKYEKGIGRIPAEKLSALAEWLKIDPAAVFYPLAVLDSTSTIGFADVASTGHGGFADIGSHYQPAPTGDAEAAQLLRDFQKIASARQRQIVLDLVGTLARADDPTPPSSRKRR